MEKVRRGGATVNALNSVVLIKQAKAGKQGPPLSAIDRKRAEHALEAAWVAEKLLWEEETTTEFPALKAGVEVWAKAVSREAPRVLHLLRRTPGPHMVLNHLKWPVIIGLVQQLREELMVRVLQGLADKTKEDATRR